MSGDASSEFRERFEAWWDLKIVEGQELKDPYTGIKELWDRLDELAADATERRWIDGIVLDWLESTDEMRWHPALSLVVRERLPQGPAALRAAVSPACTESKHNFAETFLRRADDLEQELIVPPTYRTEFNAWWEERSGSPGSDSLLHELNARVDDLGPDAPEREWVNQLMIERIDGFDTEGAQEALAFVREHQVPGAIHVIRRKVGWHDMSDTPEVEALYLAAADDIAEAAGWPVAFATPPGNGRAAEVQALAPPAAEAYLSRVPGPVAPVWAPKRRRPVKGPLDFTSRREIEARHDLIAALGRRTQDPRPAEAALAQWIDEGDPAEQGWVFEILTDWLVSRDPWRWHVALSLLERYGVKSAANAMRAAVDPPNTDDKSRWAQEFRDAADRLGARRKRGLRKR